MICGSSILVARLLGAVTGLRPSVTSLASLPLGTTSSSCLRVGHAGQTGPVHSRGWCGASRWHKAQCTAFQMGPLQSSLVIRAPEKLLEFLPFFLIEPSTVFHPTVLGQ